MRYFDSLPYITNTDYNGNFYLLKNLLVRTELIPTLAKNPLLVYTYEIRDGDSPEIIANKYYGDPYRYWIVLYGNPNIVDPQADWPLSSQQFLLYLTDKYSSDAANASMTLLAYTQSTIHHYEKVITTFDTSTQTKAIKVVDVDLNTYLSTLSTTTTGTFPDGSSVTYTVSTNQVSIYDYEYQTNENKRNISLINSSYASRMETQYQSLVSA